MALSSSDQNTTGTTPAERRAAHDKLWDMVRDIRFGMLTSRNADGELRSRPLTTQNRELDSDAQESLWFFVSRSSEVASEIADDPLVNVAFADTDNDRYVSVSGSARLVEDVQRVEALWSAAAKAWFPGGPTDPDLQLVAVKVEGAEYWDVKINKATQLLKMARAAVTGKPPHMGEHRKLG
ncbi:MAG: pyridoxamine 5'-phosphate oxidase family protein [Methylibium sp.]|nr:pyridoxamine 5'-phosphate oxidase family protein [Methylibium sp.]